MEYRDQESN